MSDPSLIPEKTTQVVKDPVSGKTTTTTVWKEQLKPGSAKEEWGHFKKWINLDMWQFLVIIGIAVSGLAAFINTYNAITNINENLDECVSGSKDLQRQVNVKFAFSLALSIFAIILGSILAWVFRRKADKTRLITIGIITLGIFGIIYSFSLVLQQLTNNVKLWASWIAFIGFIIVGIFLSLKQNVGVQAPITDKD